MGHLAQRMHARIRAARPLHHGRLAIDFGYGVRQHPLNGGVARLNLPAVKGRAIIFQCQPVARHQVGFVPGAMGNPRKNVAASITSFPSR